MLIFSKLSLRVRSLVNILVLANQGILGQYSWPSQPMWVSGVSNLATFGESNDVNSW